MKAGKADALIGAVKRTIVSSTYPLFLRAVHNGLPGFGTDFRRFVVVTPGRSGSTFLLQRLNSHPEITCYGEVFHSDGAHFNVPYFAYLQIQPWRHGTPLEFLERHIWRPHRSSVGAVGAKLIYNQVAVQERRDELMLALRDTAVIMLRRRDLMASYISQQRATKTRIYTHTEENELKQEPIRIHLDHCAGVFENIATCERYYSAVFADCDLFDLEYEDLAARPADFDGPLCDFLQVSRQPMHHRTRKMAKGHWTDQVSNADEVRRHFRGTKWAYLFE